MTLIDTSVWIHSLRRDGDANVRTRVRLLLESGEAAWCELVQLELWSGAKGDHERQARQDMEIGLPRLATTADVWSLAMALARRARRCGVTVPATDLLIAACARHHGVHRL